MTGKDLSDDISKGIVSEPEVAYSNHKNHSIQHILELKQDNTKMVDELAWIDTVKGGVPKSSIARVGTYLGLTVEELCVLLHISARTWQRKPAEEVWDGDIAERGVELAELVAKGIDVLGSIPSLRAWIRTPLRALGHRTPLSIMDNIRGIRLSMDVLGRLEQGVYS